MLANLIPNLITLIVTVRKNIFASVMTTLFILAIITAWSARGNIAAWFENNPSPQQRNERVERAGQSNQKIEQALRADMAAIGADRVLIRQFHHQSDPQSSVSIPYVTTTHIVTAPGVSPPATGLTTMPRSYLNDVTSRVWSNGQTRCIHIFTSDVADEIYKRLLIESGVHEQYICPILDLNGGPVGLIMAGFLTDTKARPTQEQIFDKLNGTSVRVAGYLAEVTAPERTPWYRQLLSF